MHFKVEVQFYASEDDTLLGREEYILCAKHDDQARHLAEQRGIDESIYADPRVQSYTRSRVLREWAGPDEDPTPVTSSKDGDGRYYTQLEQARI
jgi:hypothetical protein